MDYETFLGKKSQIGENFGFKPLFLPKQLFDFQELLVEWAVNKGRGAEFTDCGTGKTIIGLTWSENVVRHTNKPVLVICPLTVSAQTVREASKFGIEAYRSREGKLYRNIVVTNYEQLRYYSPGDFAGVWLDESGILKNFAGHFRKEITIFMRKIPYRLLTSATPAPNDFDELGTSSESLGGLGYMDMLNRFFKNDLNNSATNRHYGERVKWRLKGHAELKFWQWVCSWARAMRRPSDIGFDDGKFILPQLIEREHIVKTDKAPEGMLFNLPAIGLREQRAERRLTLEERCETAANLVNFTGNPAIVWCDLNDEGDLLEKMIPDGIQVSGNDKSDEEREEKLLSFIDGKSRVLITKPKIAALGLNLQHCSHMTFFPSHSFEQYYQGVRRCLRFGQKNEVVVDNIATEGQLNVMKNRQRKAAAADEMFTSLIREMNNACGIFHNIITPSGMEVPLWMKKIN